MPRGVHTGKRGRKSLPEGEGKTAEFVVGCTPADKARFLEAGGSPWALKVLQDALDSAPTVKEREQNP